MGLTNASLVFTLLLAIAATPIGPAVNTAQALTPAPAPDWTEEMQEILEELLKELEDAELAVLISNRAAAVDHIDEAIAIVAQVLDVNQSPTMDPADAGAIDGSYAPGSIQEYALDCRTLAQDAWWESQLSSNLDVDALGTYLRTLEDLLPAYRALADA